MNQSQVKPFPITRTVAKALWAVLRLFFWLPWWCKLIVISMGLSAWFALGIY